MGRPYTLLHLQEPEDEIRMRKGHYAIIEGMDGAGKTTAMHEVKSQLEKKLKDNGLDTEVLSTSHPGSTPLGKHIRRLVKFPASFNSSINIDNLTRQILYMADTSSFIRTLLEPALDDNKIVLADRSSFISAIVYGMAEGLDIHEIDKLLNVITPPKADHLFILQLPASKARQRLSNSQVSYRGNPDHFDSKDSDFFESIAVGYDNLLNDVSMVELVSKLTSISNVRYVDATVKPEHVAATITDTIFDSFLSRCYSARKK